jgi:photosystem II stability/assembly factor-like uncharacterized protein
MEKARLVLSLLLLLMVGLILGGCSGSPVVTVPPEITVTPGMAVTVPPIVLPSATPAAMPNLPRTASPASGGESRWQCDPSGGPACYSDLYHITMLNAQEGWAVGDAGVVLHYNTPPGSSQPIWQQVTSPPSSSLINAFSMVSATEGWGIQGSSILHYQDGAWEVVPPPVVAPFSDIVMLNDNEGWIVGDHGVILHYTEGKWQNVPGPTNVPIAAIDMLDSEEGWAVSSFGSLLHYHNQQWKQIDFRSVIESFRILI